MAFILFRQKIVDFPKFVRCLLNENEILFVLIMTFLISFG
jgi:hypothetical protein